MSKTTTIRLPASRFADFDDSLAAAAEDIAEQSNLHGWDLNPRWEDDEREVILLDVPAVLGHLSGTMFGGAGHKA